MRTFAVLAMMGLVGSLLWHVLALWGRVTEFRGPVLVLVIGLFVVLFPALAAGLKRARGLAGAHAWRAMLGPRSKWAERLMGGAMMYTAVIGALMQRTPYLAWLGPASRTQASISAGWLMCYLIAALLLSAELGAPLKSGAARQNGRHHDQAV